MTARHGMMLGVLIVQLATAVGCKGYDKPRDLRDKPRPYLPDYDTEEQARRIRGRFSIPQDDRAVGPRTGLERHTPVGW